MAGLGGRGKYNEQTQSAINAAKDALRKRKERDEQKSQQGKFPGHPSNAASVSDDYNISYDKYNRQLDSNGNVAYGSFEIGGNKRRGGGGYGGGAPAAPIAAGPGWAVPGQNQWAAMMQQMQGLTPPATPDLRSVAPMDVSGGGITGTAVGPGLPPAAAATPAPATPAPATPAPAAPSAVAPAPQTPQELLAMMQGMPAWTQPGYAGGTNPGLKDDQFQRMLAAAAGIYFPYMNFAEGQRQFNQNFGEQALNNAWSRQFQEGSFNKEFGEGQRQFDLEFEENKRRYGQDYAEAKRRWENEMSWRKAADAFNVTGRALLPRARYVTLG